MTSVRVACHVHSDWSYDGSWSLPKLAEAFARRGYDAILLAEHDRGFDQNRWSAFRRACAQASSSEIVLVPGMEYSDPTNTVHVPVWGDIPFIGEGLETASMLEQADDAGGFAVLAHPGRRDVLSTLDPAWLGHLSGIELWNRKYDGYAPNRDVAELLRERSDLLTMVSLDFHTARQFHPLAMQLEVDGQPTEASICDALHARRAHAVAFGVSAIKLARGPAGPAVRSLERGRRRAARQLRTVRRLRAGARP